MTQFVEVATTADLPAGAMRMVTVGETDVLLANVDGVICAMSNRCGHMNGPLAEGTLDGRVVQCPFHGARFDVTTGKKLGDAVISPPPGIEKAPPEMMPFLTKAGRFTARIKTLDCPRFEVLVEGDRVMLAL